MPPSPSEPTKADFTRGVEPAIAGTRLAYHLARVRREFAGRDDRLVADVDKALRGEYGPSSYPVGNAKQTGDVFSRIGKRLQEHGHELGSAYNWHRVGDSLQVDAAVRNAVLAVTAAKDRGRRDLFDAVVRRFVTGADPRSRQFLDHVRSHVASRTKGVVHPSRVSDEMIRRSLARQRYREQDAAELGKTLRDERKTAPKDGRRVDPWSTYMNYLPAKGSAEQYRRLRYSKLGDLLRGKLDRIRKALAKPVPADVRGELDGILHRGRDADGVARSLAERSAVARGLQQLGLIGVDPRENRRVVHEYVRRAGLVADRLPEHPAVARYVGVASRLTAPDVYRVQVEGQDADRRRYLTVDAGDPPSGGELTEAVLPLLREILPHFPADLRAAKASAESQRSPAAPPAEPKRPRRLKDADADAGEPEFVMPSIRPAESTPLKPVRVRGEVGRGGLRHRFIAEHEAAGKSRDEIHAALQHEFLLTPREASATLSGYRAATRPKTRLSRLVERIRYARPAKSSFADALARLKSENQRQYHAVVRKIAKATGLDPTRSVNAIHDTAAGLALNTVAQAVYHDSDPDTVRYAAAWYGLLTQTPSLAVFHVAADGPDSVYKFHLKGTGDRVRRNLDHYGVAQRVLVPRGRGFDVVVYDAGRKLRKGVERLARVHGSTVHESVGVGELVGGRGDGAKASADSRADYRSVIRAYEGGGESAGLSRTTRGGRPVKFSHGAFQAGLRQRPSDVVAAGAYADWLEENGLATGDTLRLLREGRPIHGVATDTKPDDRIVAVEDGDGVRLWHARGVTSEAGRRMRDGYGRGGSVFYAPSDDEFIVRFPKSAGIDPFTRTGHVVSHKSASSLLASFPDHAEQQHNFEYEDFDPFAEHHHYHNGERVDGE